MSVDKQWYIGPLCIDLCSGHGTSDVGLGIRFWEAYPPLESCLSFYFWTWCLSLSWNTLPSEEGENDG